MSKAAELAEFGSGISSGPNAVDGLAKSWVDFNGSGTIAIRDSFSVSSITDNGTSDYTTTFASAMSNDDFAVSAQSTSTGAGYICNAPKNAASGSISTTIIRSIGIDFNGNTNDHEFVHHIIHGDLA
tara:strand:+ start:1515 stop:1895 length:381 start_codon:yes stop_codon:yes gene_type:complete